MNDHEYVDNRNYIAYEEGATFIRRCPQCSRFVKPNKSIRINGDGLINEPNAVCKIHGEVQMPFIGFL